METFSVSFVRQHLPEITDKVCGHHTPVLVTQKKGKPMVLISLDEYTALQETAYLMSTPANARRLMDAAQQFKEKNGVMHDLPDHAL